MTIDFEITFYSAEKGIFSLSVSRFITSLPSAERRQRSQTELKMRNTMQVRVNRDHEELFKGEFAGMWQQTLQAYSLIYVPQKKSYCTTSLINVYFCIRRRKHMIVGGVISS